MRVFISCVTHRQTEYHTSLWVFICYVTHRQTEYLNLMRVSISCVTHRQTESLGDRLTNKRNTNIDKKELNMYRKNIVCKPLATVLVLITYW